MQVRCFVAMAFGKKDSDKIYKVISKILKSRKIMPIRIDRKEHNNDIDKEIISELKKSDLIVSDLTYARPSVYFEAGFGEGSNSLIETKKPVVYTCRKDHLSGKKDDQFGNFKVHFDLQMKNIIPWKNENDNDFKKKFGKRINHVLSPLLKLKNSNDDEIKKTKSFSNLSLENKTNAIFEKGISKIRHNGYSGIIVDGFKYEYRRGHVNPILNIRYPYSSSYTKKTNLLNPFWIGFKFSRGVKHYIYFHVENNITKSLIDYCNEVLLKNPVYNINPTIKSKQIKKFDEYLILTSFNKTSPQKILGYLGNYSYNDPKKLFNWNGSQDVPIKNHLGWKEIFYFGGSRYSDNFGAHFGKIRGNGYDIQRYTISGRNLEYAVEHKNGTTTHKHIPLKKIPRSINVILIDELKHIDNFSEKIKNTLKLIN